MSVIKCCITTSLLLTSSKSTASKHLDAESYGGHVLLEGRREEQELPLATKGFEWRFWPLISCVWVTPHTSSSNYLCRWPTLCTPSCRHPCSLCTSCRPRLLPTDAAAHPPAWLDLLTALRCALGRMLLAILMALKRAHHQVAQGAVHYGRWFYAIMAPAS